MKWIYEIAAKKKLSFLRLFVVALRITDNQGRILVVNYLSKNKK